MMADGGSVVILEDVTERKRAQERITHLAKFDELTGLANRDAVPRAHQRHAGDRARARRITLTIHLIDLDRFKAINDTLGHPIGDKLLKEVAFRLSAVIRPGDMITRFGGDEFVVLQTVTERRQDAEWLAQARWPARSRSRSRSTAIASTSAPRSASPWRRSTASTPTSC